MRGQVSLEFMVVLAVFLAMLALWLGGVSSASHAIDAALGARQAELAAERLAYTINAVCVMGAGNSLEAEVSVPGNASAMYSDGLSLQWKNESFEETVYCGFNSLTLSGKQSLLFENTGGFISIG